MAITAFGTNDAQTVQEWSEKTIRESLKGTLHFKSLLQQKGQNDNQGIIRVINDLEKNHGDVVKYDLLMQTKNPGVRGNNKLEDNEAKLVYYQDELKIEQLRHAHSWNRMSQQRSIHKLRKDAKGNLADWGSWIFESYAMRMLAGDTSLTHGQTGQAADTAHTVIAGGKANEAALTSSDRVTLDEIDYIKEKAMMADPPVRPVRIAGKDVFVLILHPYCWTDLKLNLGASTKAVWMTVHQYASKRGADNPIFTGAEGVYNNVIIRVSHYLYSPSSNVYRNLFLGANAGSFAIGNAYSKNEQARVGSSNYMSWYEKEKDYGNEQSVAVGMIFGFKKNRFNSKDYGLMTLSAYSAAKR